MTYQEAVAKINEAAGWSEDSKTFPPYASPQINNGVLVAPGKKATVRLLEDGEYDVDFESMGDVDEAEEEAEGEVAE